MKKFFYLGIFYPLVCQASTVNTDSYDTFIAAATGGTDVDIVLSKDIDVPETHTYKWISHVTSIDGGGYTISGGGKLTENKNYNPHDVSSYLYTYEGYKNTTQFIRNDGHITEIKDITFDGIINLNIKDDADDEFGGALTNAGTIDKMTNVKFTNNLSFNGGAIANTVGSTIGSIDGYFANNKAGENDDKQYEASGSVIFNQGYIGNISGTFENNTAALHAVIWSWGDGVGNNGSIGNISATFTGNHRSVIGGNGGGTIKITNSTFKDNDTYGGIEYYYYNVVKDENGNIVVDDEGQDVTEFDWKGTYGQSGAALHFYGGKEITVENSNFEGNYAYWKGGAVFTAAAGDNITVSNSIFTNNHAGEEGGAFATYGKGTITINNSTFSGNYANYWGGTIYNNASTYIINGSTLKGSYGSAGGSIANAGTMQIADSYIQDNSSSVQGGGIRNAGTMTITDTEITGNYNTNNSETASGGGIYNSENGTLDVSNGKISGNTGKYYGGGLYVASGKVTLNGTEIKDNKAGKSGGALYAAAGDNTDGTEDEVILTNVELSGNASGEGGAVHSLMKLTINADGKDITVADNNTATNNIAVYTDSATLTLATQNSGHLLFDDIVDGKNYTLSVSGDDSGYVQFNNEVNNISTLNIADGGTLHLLKNQTMAAENYTGNGGNLLLDIELDAEAVTLTNGLIEVSGDVSGYTNVIVNSLNTNTVDETSGLLSPFVSAPDDDTGTAADFAVGRVIGSPYMWKTLYNVKGNETGSVWYLGVKEQETTDTDTDPSGKPSYVYTPEIGAYAVLPSALIEQNRHLTHSVEDALAVGEHDLCSVCYKKRPSVQNRLWANAGFKNAQIDKPADVDADITFFTAGVDLWASPKWRLGIFGSYSDGEYELSGKGDYYSDISSSLDITSWLGGAYARYENGSFSLLTLAYGGEQDADADTADNLAAASTSAVQYGAAVDAGYAYPLSDSVKFVPDAGVSYTMIDADEISDTAGKTASYDTIHYLEAELGLKLEYAFQFTDCPGHLYVKPSVIQTVTSGNSAVITGIGKTKGKSSATLGCIELGQRFGIVSDLSGYARAAYTFGSDYSAADVSLGLNYAF